MIKVESLYSKEKEVTTLFFESRTTSNEDLEKLDELYNAIATLADKKLLLKLGYDNSNSFSLIVRTPEVDI
jgi:hypothetical protein